MVDQLLAVKVGDDYSSLSRPLSEYYFNRPNHDSRVQSPHGSLNIRKTPKDALNTGCGEGLIPNVSEWWLQAK